MPQLDETGAAFDTTEWSLLGILREPGHPRRDEARAHLIERYWPPVYAWLRRRGMPREEAAEVTQAFFTDVVLGRGLFERARSECGRLRTLILTSLRNFVVDQSRRRGNSALRTTMSLPRLDEEDRLLEQSSAEGDDDVFDRRWALAVLEESIRRCEGQYRDTGRDDYWQAFEARVLQPSITGNDPRPLTELASELGFRDGAHVSVAVHLVKTRCRNLLSQVVAETLDEQDDLDGELRELTALLA